MMKDFYLDQLLLALNENINDYSINKSSGPSSKILTPLSLTLETPFIERIQMGETSSSMGVLNSARKYAKICYLMLLLGM